MIDPDVRRATERDVDELIALEHGARQALVGHRGGDRWLDDHRPLGQAWSDAIRDAIVFVAVIDDVVVGYLAGRVDGDRARVEDVFVHPEARECGFGSALLAEGLAAFAEEGATVVDGEALPGDRETKNLYERAGITARLITLSAPLNRRSISS